MVTRRALIETGIAVAVAGVAPVPLVSAAIAAPVAHPSIYDLIAVHAAARTTYETWIEIDEEARSHLVQPRVQIGSVINWCDDDENLRKRIYAYTADEVRSAGKNRVLNPNNVSAETALQLERWIANKLAGLEAAERAYASERELRNLDAIEEAVADASVAEERALFNLFIARPSSADEEDAKRLYFAEQDIDPDTIGTTDLCMQMLFEHFCTLG